MMRVIKSILVAGCVFTTVINGVVIYDAINSIAHADNLTALHTPECVALKATLDAKFMVVMHASLDFQVLDMRVKDVNDKKVGATLPPINDAVRIYETMINASKDVLPVLDAYIPACDADPAQANTSSYMRDRIEEYTSVLDFLKTKQTVNK